jgi:tetratricopeptide (TPR) repeat protein
VGSGASTHTLQVIRVTRRPDRWLDIAIRGVVVVAVLLAAYLGYSYWSSTRTQQVSSPAGRAIENLAAIVRSNPGNATNRVRLAEALAFSGRLPEAVEQYDSALKLQPDMISALSGLATIAMKRRDFVAAEEYWKQVIAKLDTTVMAGKDLQLDAAYYGLGVTYIEMERYEDALRNLKEATRIKMAASDTHYQMSIAYARLGYPENQRQELAITLAFDPNNAQANYDLGLLEVQASKLATAAELFRISVDRAPEANAMLPQAELDKLAAASGATARLERARLTRTSAPEAALTEARIATALDPLSADSVRLVAQLWEQAGNKERALNAYERLAELEPNDAAAAEAIKRLSTNAK